MMVPRSWMIQHATAQTKPDDFTIPFHPQKSPKITSKKSSYFSTITFSGRLLTLVKIPLFLDRFHYYAGTTCQKHPYNLRNGWIFLVKSPWVNNKFREDKQGKNNNNTTSITVITTCKELTPC